MLISGLNKILSAITEMRNKNSDSHGVGLRRKNIKRHHALLFLNSATTMAEFIMSVVDNCNQTKTYKTRAKKCIPHFSMNS